MWTWSCRSAFQNHSQSQGVVFLFFFVCVCVCVCVLYYKFILYITRGAPNKAVKKKDRSHKYIVFMNRVNSVYYRFQESLHSRA